MTQQGGSYVPPGVQPRYGCGHVIPPSDTNPYPQMCRECSWLMLFKIEEFVDGQNETCIEEVEAKINACDKKYHQAVLQGDRRLEQEILHRRLKLKADIKQIREARGRYRQQWVDRWRNRYGEASNEEVSRWEKWQREQFEMEEREEFQRLLREEDARRHPDKRYYKR